MPYIVAVNLLLADLLHEIVDLVLCRDQVVCQDLLVQRPIVRDDHCHVAANVAQVGQGRGHVSVADNLIVARRHGVVDATRAKARVRQLVPPADIDDGVWEPHLADLVVHNLFLSGTNTVSSATGPSAPRETHLVTQPHDAAGGRDGDETTGNESLDADPLRSLGQGNLVLLLGGADTADDDIDVVQRFNELLLGSLQVAFADLHPAFLQLRDGGLGDGDWADKGEDLL